MVTNKMVGEGEKNLKFGTSIYTLLYIKQINSKGLLYSTVKCTQYLIINYNENNLKKNI